MDKKSTVYPQKFVRFQEMTIDCSQAVTIHTAIADPTGFKPTVELESELNGKRRTGRSAVQLWYLCRAIDKPGKGWVEFSCKDAAEALDKTTSSIWQYLADGKTIGLFRNVIKLGQGKVRVFYSSAVAVGVKHEMTTLGPVAEIEVKHLKDLKVWATQIAAQAIQQQSRFAAGVDAKKRRKKKFVMPEAEHILRAKSSRKSRGAKWVHEVGEQCVYVGQYFVHFGASQNTIAGEIGRSKTTVKRRLSNSYRSEKGIAPILKRQLVQEVPAQFQRQSIIAIEHDDVNIDPEKRKRLFIHKHRAYYKRCNLYDREFTIKSGRSTRRQLRRKLAESLESEP